ncbi:MAG: molybdate ABC transporter substrate-binding protein [Pasteurellaceae bacterium]|nr:molybdate ABC transporter substrate-binding protein [Pasteurellaceae bacterium]
MKTFIKQLSLIIGATLAVSQLAQAKVTVFAAASMTNALEQIKTEYQKANPKEEIAFSFASSSVLAKQIEQGAPADLFVSADQKWMDYLADKQLIVANTRAVLVGNSLVMIAPKDSKISTVDFSNNKWEAALNGSFLAVGDPEHVPAGIYAKTALTNLGQWSDVENKLARADSVRKALALVEVGESPLGIVYGTDAAISQKVKIVGVFPDSSHPPVEYPVAIVKDHDNAESQAFLRYLESDIAKNVFKQYGFLVK